MHSELIGNNRPDSSRLSGDSQGWLPMGSRRFLDRIGLYLSGELSSLWAGFNG